MKTIRSGPPHLHNEDWIIVEDMEISIYSLMLYTDLVAGE